VKLALSIAVALLATWTGAAPAAQLRIGTLEQVQNDWQSLLGARWRDLGQDARGEPNMYLEAPSVTPPPDAQVVVTPLPRLLVPFSFAYDGDDAVASMSFGRVGLSFDYTGLERRPVGFNDLLIKVRVPQNGAIGLTGLALDGIPLTPDFTANRLGGEQFWFVLDAIAEDSFALTGTFSGGGLSNSNEANRFEVAAGNFSGTFAAIPLPGTLPLLLMGLAGLAVTAARRRTA
jgi:hypothetical protein